MAIYDANGQIWESIMMSDLGLWRSVSTWALKVHL